MAEEDSFPVGGKGRSFVANREKGREKKELREEEGVMEDRSKPSAEKTQSKPPKRCA